MVQAEPWLERDRAMIDPLKTIGIESGKPFQPDARTQQILNGAIQEAKAWFDARYDTLPPYYEGGHWFFPVTEEMIQNVHERSGRRRTPIRSTPAARPTHSLSSAPSIWASLNTIC